MRKILFIGLAAALGAAALLIPAGATGAPTADTAFRGSVTETINVACATGATLGSATYTVSTSAGGSGNTGTAPVNIQVSRGAVPVASLDSETASATVTEGSFPCPGGVAGANGATASATFTFQPVAVGGQSATASATAVRTEDGS